jgi:hypothetical protein
MYFLGIDTGGTFTDAVITDPRGSVMASAKALTRHEDLVLGIRDAVLEVLASAPQISPDSLSMACLSTTLATNAIVEGRGGSAALVLAGGDPGLIRRGGLREALDGDPWLHVAGGHDAGGNERDRLDLEAVDRWLQGPARGAAAFAVCTEFAVVNSAHELSLRRHLRQRTGAPVTCSHELSSALNAPVRALTALLNARLLPRITQLMDAVEAVLRDCDIPARLMVVKGDGSLLEVSMARERPVETLLSGPAASVVGAAHLCGEPDVMVADIGGTTTDIAVLRDGRPRLDPLGATVGGVRTLVQAVSVHSVGLGGDSEVAVDDGGALRVGPTRILPVCRLLHEQPGLLGSLRERAGRTDPGIDDLRFVWRPHQDAAPRLRRDEQELWQRLPPAACIAAEVAPDRYHAGLLQRLIQRGLVAVAGLTPTDAAHAAGRHVHWHADAARVLLDGWRRHLAERFPGRWSDGEDIGARVLQSLTVGLGEALLDAAYTATPRPPLERTHWQAAHPLLRHALRRACGNAESPGAAPPAEVFRIAPLLMLPLVAVGASAQCHFPAVAGALQTGRRGGRRVPAAPHPHQLARARPLPRAWPDPAGGVRGSRRRPGRGRQGSPRAGARPGPARRGRRVHAARGGGAGGGTAGRGRDAVHRGIHHRHGPGEARGRQALNPRHAGASRARPAAAKPRTRATPGPPGGGPRPPSPSFRASATSCAAR